MTIEEAKLILHPDTTLIALEEVEYYAGFKGAEARVKAVEEACRVACQAIEELQVYKQAEQDGTLVKLPCKKGDTIIQFKWVTSVGMSIYSDKVTKVVQSKNGFTIYTKKVFYPIKTEEYDIAPISEYPNALADFYIGTKEEAEKALEGMK